MYPERIRISVENKVYYEFIYYRRFSSSLFLPIIHKNCTRRENKNLNKTKSDKVNIT